VAAQIELGKLLEQILAGRQPESGATIAQLLDQYAQVAEWDLSTRTGFGGGWAQVIDVEVIRTVTEWLLPGLECRAAGRSRSRRRRRARTPARCPTGRC
jgi:hypothetical protein